VFLLNYISDARLQRQITATTNKVESYHGFSKWCYFGADGVIAENDPEEQEKRIKYNDIVANACILHNVVDMTAVLRQLLVQGHEVNREAVAALSPYLTRHVKRFGDYVLDMDQPAPPLQGDLEELT
jgi:TnpA family transposase